MKKRAIIIEIISYAFIVLFVYAATSKLMDYEKFRIQIGQSPLLTAYADWVTWAIPVIEILIAVGLSTLYRKYAFYASFTLMTLFTAYIIAVLNFTSRVPCSCGGILEQMGWTEHLIFNTLFIFLALWAIILGERQPETLQK